MTTAYTSLLGLALPVTGELSGTWGDVVNNSITTLLDSAIAGTTTLSTDTDVTLTTTTGSANTAREAILLWTANGTVTRSITAPAQSKIYTVINASAGTQSIVLRGAGPTTGVTIVKGESAVCAWNGTDFIKISNTSGAGTFTNLTVTGNTILGDASADTVTVNGTVTSNLIFTDNTYDIGASGATRPRNLYLAGLLTMGGALTVNGNTTLGDASADTVTVNGTITSNLLFTDNTYDIGASGATRPRNLYLAGNEVVAGSVTWSGGTANGVAYLNGSKVATTGSSLTFDGTNFAVGGSGMTNIIGAKNGYMEVYQAADLVASGFGYRFYADGGGAHTLQAQVLAYQQTVGSAASTLIFGTNNGTNLTNYLYLSGDGRLSLGTTTVGTSGPLLALKSNGASNNAGIVFYNSSATQAGKLGTENATTSTDIGLYSAGYVRVYTAGEGTTPTLVANNLTLGIGIGSNAAISYNGTTFTPYLRVGNSGSTTAGLAVVTATTSNCPQMWFGYGVNAASGQTLVFDDNSNFILGAASFAERVTGSSFGLYVKTKIAIGTTTTDGSLSIGGATTGSIYQTTKNTGGSLLMGVESSSGGSLIVGGASYAAVINQQNNYSLQLGANNTVYMSMNSAANYIDLATNIILRTNSGGYIYSYGRYTNANNHGTIVYQNGSGYNGCWAEVAASTWALGSYNSGDPSTAIMNNQVIRYNASGYTAIGTYQSGALPTSGGGVLTVTGSAASGTPSVINSIQRGGTYCAAYVSASDPGFDWQFGKGAQTGSSTNFEWGTSGGGGAVLMSLTSGGNLTVYGSLSKGSGSFVIDHPLPEKEETHYLVHSFIEGPQADLIYRGRVTLVNGRAEVNIDTASDMTDGTLMALCRDLQCFTTNESDWFHVRGSISGNILTIESQEPTATSSISWMVIGERKDKHMIETSWTDENGKIIVEPTKASREYDPTTDPLNLACPDYDRNAVVQVKPWLKH